MNPTETYWHPEDKDWMAERKRAWVPIKRHLDVFSSGRQDFKRKYHKYHKDLFFFGTLNPECWENETAAYRPKALLSGAEPFLWMLPVFQIWYHPAPQTLDIARLRAGVPKPNVEAFFLDYWPAGAKPARPMWDPTWGMMGGREAQVVRFLAPPVDDRITIQSHASDAAISLGIPVSSAVRWAFSGARDELVADARFVPYAPGQYLWDHLSDGLEQAPDYDLRRIDRENLLAVMDRMLRFDQLDPRVRRRVSTVAMVERLLGQYERKEFSPRLLALWEDAKRMDVALRESFSMVFYQSEEKLDRSHQSCCGGWPIAKQRERVERWNLR